MPRWRIELMNGAQTQLEASAADIAQIRIWLEECGQPIRDISLIGEGIQWSVKRDYGKAATDEQPDDSSPALRRPRWPVKSHV